MVYSKHFEKSIEVNFVSFKFSPNQLKMYIHFELLCSAFQMDEIEQDTSGFMPVAGIAQVIFLSLTKSMRKKCLFLSSKTCSFGSWQGSKTAEIGD